MKLNVFLFLALAMLMACNHSNHGSHSTVELNNGKKWEANPETTEGIQNMQSLLNSFQVQGKALTADDYQQLGENLQQEFDLIFKRCTMKGEAHEQLHNYLFPMVEQLKVLKSEEDTAAQETAAQKLNAHLQQYGNYFT